MMEGSDEEAVQPAQGNPNDAHSKQQVEAGDVASALEGLVDIQEHDDIERDVSTQAKAAAVEEENKKDEARIENLRLKIQKLQEKRASLISQKEQKELARVPQNQLTAIANQVTFYAHSIIDMEDEIVAFEGRIKERNEAHASQQAPSQQAAGGDTAHAGPTQQEGEDRRAFLIRTGKITPFAPFTEATEDDSDEQAAGQAIVAEPSEVSGPQIQTSHQVLRQPGFAPRARLVRQPIDEDGTPEDALATNLQTEFGLRPRKRQRVPTAVDEAEKSADEAGPTPPKRRRRRRPADEDADYDDRGEEDVESIESSGETAPEGIKLSVVDDANEALYNARLSTWVAERQQLRETIHQEDGGDSAEDEELEEWYRATPGKPNHTIMEDYVLPEEVYDFLFPFQRVGIKWLAQLHMRKEGGILCDEMGLGKTVQIISFIAALHFSKKLDGPIIIVAPATLISQWVKHFHTWWPPLRVAILHSTGSGMMNPELEDATEFSSTSDRKTDAAKKIINTVLKEGHVLVTTYRGLHTYLDELALIDWGYAVLDEGHQIRNRNTDAAKACKQLNTWHRIIISGTPVQNNLRELFSLFEFAFPGLLGGELRDFVEHFENPIRDGHKRTAGSLDIATGDRVSKTLRETVKPYMLRRIKADVADSLPPKKEQVFFCKLTPDQESIYKAALESPDVKRVFNFGGNRGTEVLAAIDTLRKICSHPDMRQKVKYKVKDWGDPKRSVKMQVLAELLRISKRFGHKTLVFSQSLEILSMIEAFLLSERMTFVRMDGRTNQSERQNMVDRFNEATDLDVFLLTPQTGGVGLNLTGADRVILFDPAWNPATDRQAIERAWRLGQTKPVKIYRLLTQGTIEEKMYRKQLYKQFVSERVMSDTDFNRYVDTTNLYDLFTYGCIVPDENLGFDSASSTFKQPSSGPQRFAERREAAAREARGTENQALDSVKQVRGVEEYQDETVEEKDMLETVFSTNTETVYDHEKIINGGKRVKADTRMTEYEADKMNERTVKFLRNQASKAYFDRQGGKPKSKLGRGIGSTERQWTLAKVKPVVVRFLKGKGGKAASADLVSYFNRQYSDVSGDLLKRALDAVCNFEEKPGRGKSVWRLKRGL